MQNGVNGALFFWPKIKLFRESVHQLFLKLYVMAGIEISFSVTVWIFKENSYYAKNGENGPFLWSTLTFLKFFQNL